MDPQQDPYGYYPPQDPNPPADPPAEDGATAFARAKLEAIYGQNVYQPNDPYNYQPGSSTAPTTPAPQIHPPTTELYAQETVLQDEIQPQYHHISPDHQLQQHAPNASGSFQTMNIPVQPVAGETPAHHPGELPPSHYQQYHSQAHVLPPTHQPTFMQSPPTRLEQVKQFALNQSEQISQKKGHILRPVVRFALLTLFVFLIYNAPIITGQLHYYITPAASSPSTVILDDPTGTAVSAEPKIIIARLGIDAPVVYDETSYDEERIQQALQRGIVHYGTTGLPNGSGNSVFLGHSSNSPWDPGRYKTVFSILRRLEVGDTIVLHYQSKRYIYEVYEKKVIDPSDFSVIDQNVGVPIVTLITCDPPGVNWRRLAIHARQISPDPSTNSGRVGEVTDPGQAIPGSPPSLIDRVRSLF